MPPTRRQYLRHVGRAGSVVATGILAGCTSNTQPDSNPVTVQIGSKPFTEELILGYLAYEKLRTVDWIQAVDDIGGGNSLSNWKATAAGNQHLYWEYTGTAWLHLPPRHETRITDPEKLFERVQSDAHSRQLRMAQPASFSNEYVIAADAMWAAQRDVSNISELAAYLRDDNQTPGIAVNEEFYHRDDGWRGLTSHYEIETDVRDTLESETITVTSIGLTYELLEQDRVQIASGFATDPQLDRSSITVLHDDRNYFLPYQPALTAYAPLIEDHPEIFEILSPVTAALSESTMRRLNRRVLMDGDHPFTVATQFVDETVVDDE